MKEFASSDDEARMMNRFAAADKPKNSKYPF